MREEKKKASSAYQLLTNALNNKGEYRCSSTVYLIKACIYNQVTRPEALIYFSDADIEDMRSGAMKYYAVSQALRMFKRRKDKSSA